MPSAFSFVPVSPVSRGKHGFVASALQLGAAMYSGHKWAFVPFADGQTSGPAHWYETKEAALAEFAATAKARSPRAQRAALKCSFDALAALNGTFGGPVITARENAYATLHGRPGALPVDQSLKAAHMALLGFVGKVPAQITAAIQRNARALGYV